MKAIQIQSQIDSHWIQKFLEEHRSSIHGNCLVIGSDWHTHLYKSETTSLTIQKTLSKQSVKKFDTIICFQGVNGISDYQQFLKDVQNKLTNKGTLLFSIHSFAPGIYGEPSVWGMSEMAVRYVVKSLFKGYTAEFCGYGNAFAGRAVLEGKPASELSETELDTFDPYFPILTCVRLTNKGVK